jgi:hypothetical protein
VLLETFYKHLTTRSNCLAKVMDAILCEQYETPYQIMEIGDKEEIVGITYEPYFSTVHTSGPTNLVSFVL